MAMKGIAIYHYCTHALAIYIAGNEIYDMKIVIVMFHVAIILFSITQSMGQTKIFNDQIILFMSNEAALKILRL